MLLERSHVLAILSASSVERVFAWYEDAAMKVRGLYVDANLVDADGAPLTRPMWIPSPPRRLLKRPRRLRPWL